MGQVAVQNQGISGAKVLTDRMGTNALARFERDVLSQDDAGAVVLMMGINDIGWPGTGLAPNDPPADADAIIAGYRQLIARAHADGLKIYGATLTPFADCSPARRSRATGPRRRRPSGRRSTTSSARGAFDGVIDFAELVADPAARPTSRPSSTRATICTPNAAGYQVMGESIDLELFD